MLCSPVVRPHRRHLALPPWTVTILVLAALTSTACSGGDRAAVNRPDTTRRKTATGAAPAQAKAKSNATPIRAGSPAPPARNPPRAAASKPPVIDHRYDFDLRANLPLAHTVHQGLVADADQAGFDKYLRDYARVWKLGVRVDDVPVALCPPRQAELWLPVGSELGEAKLTLEVRFKAIGSRAVALFVNGKQVGEHAPLNGWHTVRQALPAGLVGPGPARVRLYFGRARRFEGTRTSAAIRYVRLARADAPALPDTEAALARALGRRASAGLRLPGGTGVDYYVTPTAGLRLLGRVAGAPLEVFGQTDGQPPSKLATVGPGKSLALPLDAHAGKALRLMLRSTGAAASETRLDHPRLAAAAGSGTGTAAKASRPPTRVIFWLIDALRADKLDFYGTRGGKRPKVKTPHLSRVASEGTVFDPFWVNSNESKASHASYFTGTYPAIHRVLNRSAKLRNSHVTLAEAFREAGFRTAAFVSNGFISSRWNYHQGFESMLNFIREGKTNDARAVVDKALPWIERHKSERFYLYLGTSDTHVSYRVHPEFISQYDKPLPYAGRYRRFLSGKELGRIKESRSKLKLRERQRIEAIYENELAFNDHHFGRLVARLKKLGLYEDTLLIISSDHGEEFWEHGSCGHGHSLHRELVSVPLVIRLPGAVPAKTTVRSGHDGVDLLPTLLALLGKQPADEVQGESLLPFIAPGRPVYPRALIASNEADSYALQVGPVKLIARSRSSIRVYDIIADPTERKNVYAKRPILTQAALDPLSLFVRRAKTWRKDRWGAPNNLTPAYSK